MSTTTLNATTGAKGLLEQYPLIPVEAVEGSGPGGRILKGDVEAALPNYYDPDTGQPLEEALSQDPADKPAKRKAAAKKTAKKSLDKARADVAAENKKKAADRKKAEAAKAKAAEKKAKEREANKIKKHKERVQKAIDALPEEVRAKGNELVKEKGGAEKTDPADIKAIGKAYREEQKAKAEAEQRAKDEAAFKQFSKMETETREVPVAKIRPKGAAGSTSSTTASMKHLGMITALTLRAFDEPDEDGYEYEVLSGERRRGDAVEQGIENVPAVIMPAETDDKTAAAVIFITNMARSSNIIHEAESMRATMEATGWSKSDVAKYFDIPLSSVSKTLKVLQLPADFYRLAQEGKIAAGVARDLVNLDAAGQQRAREVYEENGQLKVVDVRQIAKAAKEAKAADLPDEAFEDGADSYTGTGSGPLGMPLNATPEVVFEFGAAALLRAGLTVNDLTDIVNKVAAEVQTTEDEPTPF